MQIGADRPLILTLTLDGQSFTRLDGLRRRYFPPDRNQVPAHLTLFHALPGAEHRQILADLEGTCARQPRFGLEASGLRHLGRGIAIAVASPALVGLRQALAREWRDWLSPQDSARIAPHVTVQNKVSPAEARRTFDELAAGFSPFPMQADGLDLWRYLGGPWQHDRRFPFRG